MPPESHPLYSHSMPPSVDPSCSSSSSSIPALFMCPISLELMRDPVSLCTGISYARSSIETWLAQGHDTCPATMRPLDNHHLTPNHTLRRLIQQWCAANPDSFGNIDRPPTPKPPLDPHQALLLCSCLHTQSSSPPIQRLDALQQLRCLYKESESNKRCIISTLPLQTLVDLIRSEASSSSPDMDIVQEGLGLLNILPMETSAKRALTDPPQLKLIARVLLSGSVEGRVNAAQLVEALAEDKAGKARVAEEDGIIEGLVELLKQGNEHSTPTGVKMSLKALWSLTQRARSRVKLVEAQGGSVVSALIEKLLGQERETVERVMSVLDRLSSCAEGRAVISSQAMAIPSVVRCLLVVSEMTTEYAIAVLWSVCINAPGEDLLQEALQLGLLKKLLLILQMVGLSPRTLQKSKDLLRLCSYLSEDHCSSELLRQVLHPETRQAFLTLQN